MNYDTSLRLYIKQLLRCWEPMVILPLQGICLHRRHTYVWFLFFWRELFYSFVKALPSNRSTMVGIEDKNNQPWGMKYTTANTSKKGGKWSKGRFEFQIRVSWPDQIFRILFWHIFVTWIRVLFWHIIFVTWIRIHNHHRLFGHQTFSQFILT